MSAFFVSRETIHDVVFLWDSVWPTARTNDDLNTLGRSLWRLNAEAMRQRYPSIIGKPECREYFGDATAYVYRAPDQPLAQLVKSANCLSYQCSEGDVPETDLFKRLDALCNAMGEPVGYSFAKWDRA